MNDPTKPTIRRPGPARRIATALLALVVTTVGVVATTASPASATTARGVQATPYNNSSHPWSTDGCSKVPDWGPYFNFGHACVHHDGCYRGRWSDRGTCDRWFLNDMNASCNAIHPWWAPVDRARCYAVAQAYYRGVRAFGGSAFAARSHTAPLA